MQLPYFIRRRWYRLRLFLRLLRTPYWGPWEMCDPILDYAFECFCEYYEQCGKDKYAEESPWKEAKEETDELYVWYSKTRKQDEEECDYLLDEWALHYVSWWEPCKDDPRLMEYKSISTRYTEYLNQLLHEKEEEINKKEEEMFIRLVKIRNYCWE